MIRAALTLASKSEARASLLRGAGLTINIAPPGVDEDALKLAMRAEALSPKDQAEYLAEMKAVKVSAAKPGLVLGGDQMLSLDGEGFDKPQSLDEAAHRLHQFQGKMHHLETAIVIAENGEAIWRHVSRPRLTMRALGADEIDAYLKTVGEDVLASVGAYKLEGPGVQLFSAIEGDYFSILGLPLLPLLGFLRGRETADRIV